MVVLLLTIVSVVVAIFFPCAIQTKNNLLGLIIKMAFIKLQNVGLDIPVFDIAARSFKVNFLKSVKKKTPNRRIETTSNGILIVKTLSGITLSLQDGDRVGLIGRNGAGKSTFFGFLQVSTNPPKGVLSLQGSAVPLSLSRVGNG